MVGNNYAFTASVVLGTTSSSHHLEDILRAKFYPFALFRTIYLSAFDNNGMGRKIHTPSQSRS